VVHKVYFNVAFNTALIVLMGLPVLLTRKELARGAATERERWT